MSKKENKDVKHKKIAIVGLMVLTCFAGLGLAQTFNFVFNETMYLPNEYLWQESWDVSLMIDYIKCILTVTGPAYQNSPHDYVLTFENTATDPNNYILMSFDYATRWVVGEEEETLISGTHSDVLLIGGAPVEYTGIFTPTLAGLGNIAMDVTNIVWIQSETITWTTEIDLGEVVSVAVDSFVITGASRTYTETGQVQITFSTTAPGSYVEFDLTLPETGTTNFDFQTMTETNNLFTYDFDPLTLGGDLTCTVTLIRQHS